MTSLLKKSLAVAASLAVLSPAPSWAAVAARAVARPGAAATGRAAVGAVPSLSIAGIGGPNLAASVASGLKAPPVLPRPAVLAPSAPSRQATVVSPAALPAVRAAAPAPRGSAAGIGAAASAKIGPLARPMAQVVQRAAEAVRRAGPAGPKGAFPGLGRLFDGVRSARRTQEGGSPRERPAPPTEDFQRALEKARGFPAYLDELGRRLKAGKREYYIEVFGGQLSWEDWLRVVINPATRRSLNRFLAWPSSVVFHDNTYLVFYENTYLDSRTGLVYHVQPGPRKVYGPLAPPEEVRIRGDFTLEQIEILRGAMGAAAVRVPEIARLQDAGKSAPRPETSRAAVLERLERLDKEAPPAAPEAPAPSWRARLGKGLKYYVGAIAMLVFGSVVARAGLPPDQLVSAMLAIAMVALLITVVVGVAIGLMISAAGGSPAASSPDPGKGRESAAVGSPERVRMRLNAEVETRRDAPPGSPYNTAGWTLGFLKDHVFEIELKEAAPDPALGWAKRWEGAYTTVVEKDALGAPARVEVSVRLHKGITDEGTASYFLQVFHGLDLVAAAKAASLEELRGVELLEINGKPMPEAGKVETPFFGLKVLPGLMLILPASVAANPPAVAAVAAVLGGLLGYEILRETLGPTLKPRAKRRFSLMGMFLGALLGAALVLSLPLITVFGVVIGAWIGLGLANLPDSKGGAPKPGEPYFVSFLIINLLMAGVGAFLLGQFFHNAFVA